MILRPYDEEINEIRSLSQPLRVTSDLDPLVGSLTDKKIVCLGEASHGTHEFYSWRSTISRELIELGRISFIGVEGDWPDCWKIDQWVRGLAAPHLDARHVLAHFERWPTWMWANEEVANFLDWLRSFNLDRPESERVGFYGLDVYSLWDSLRAVFRWLEAHSPDSIPLALSAWRCFAPFDEEPQRYARSTTGLVPVSCADEVVELLVATREAALSRGPGDDAAFAAAQNAEVVVGAERYYRAMVRSNSESWNIRDLHMSDTLDRLCDHFGPESRALVWAHNTHVGDARATDMAHAGMINIGQITREKYGVDEVALVGFGSHRGEVIAAAEWGASERVLEVPVAIRGSHEDLLHSALGYPAVLDFGTDRSGAWLRAHRGHRAIGVVYQPRHEFGNYVPTVMGRRYDALIWLEDTTPLEPLRHEPPPREAELETAPSGF